MAVYIDVLSIQRQLEVKSPNYMSKVTPELSTGRVDPRVGSGHDFGKIPAGRVGSGQVKKSRNPFLFHCQFSGFTRSFSLNLGVKCRQMLSIVSPCGYIRPIECLFRLICVMPWAGPSGSGRVIIFVWSGVSGRESRGSCRVKKN